MNDYQLLGVAPSASLQDVRTAYKAKALQYHPDRANGNAEMFKLVLKAYNAISLRIEKGESYAVGGGSPSKSASRRTATANNFASTWSGLGTDNAEAESRAARTASFNKMASSANNHTATASSARPRASSFGVSSSAASSSQRVPSFMNATQSSKGASNPKVQRSAPSTAPSKPSTLGSVHCQSSIRRTQGTAQGIADGTYLSSSAETPFLKTVGLAVEFQKADLTHIILDVCPAALAAIGGAHLRFKAKISRRTDGMVGIVAGVSPATGAFYWQKEGSSFVSIAAGSAGDYYVIAPPPSPPPTQQATAGNKQTSPDGCGQQQQQHSGGSECGMSSASSSATTNGVKHSSSSASSLPPLHDGEEDDSLAQTYSAKSAMGSGASSNSSSARFVDPFAVTDSSNTLYFSSPCGRRRTNTVSGVFGSLGGPTLANPSRVDANVVRRAPTLSTGGGSFATFTAANQAVPPSVISSSNRLQQPSITREGMGNPTISPSNSTPSTPTNSTAADSQRSSLPLKFPATSAPAVKHVVIF